jgi:uncharacterized membrane protein
MNLLITSKKKIEELNDRFFYIMEDFIPNDVNYLKDPKNVKYKSIMERIYDTVSNINSDGHILQNNMQKGIMDNDNKIIKMNKEIAILKNENAEINTNTSKLQNQANTAEGLFNSETDWYKKQLLIIILLIIGIIFSIKYIIQLDLSRIQIIISIIIAYIFNWIYTAIIG